MWPKSIQYIKEREQAVPLLKHFWNLPEDYLNIYISTFKIMTNKLEHLHVCYFKTAGRVYIFPPWLPSRQKACVYTLITTRGRIRSHSVHTCVRTPTFLERKNPSKSVAQSRRQRMDSRTIFVFLKNRRYSLIHDLYVYVIVINCHVIVHNLMTKCS